MGKQWQTLFWEAPKSLQMVTAAMKLKDAYSLEGKLWPTRQHIKKQRHYFGNKGPSIQSYGFSNSHVWMWELNHKENWVLKSWYFSTVVLEKTLESPLDSKEIKPVHPKGNQSEYSLEGLMLKLKCQYSGHLLCRTDLLEKTLMLEKIEDRRRRGWQRMRWLVGITNSVTWVWARSSNWLKTEKPGVLQSRGLQTVGHDWATELKIPHGKCYL